MRRRPRACGRTRSDMPGAIRCQQRTRHCARQEAPHLLRRGSDCWPGRGRCWRRAGGWLAGGSSAPGSSACTCRDAGNVWWELDSGSADVEPKLAQHEGLGGPLFRGASLIRRAPSDAGCRAPGRLVLRRTLKTAAVAAMGRGAWRLAALCLCSLAAGEPAPQAAADCCHR